MNLTVKITIHTIYWLVFSMFSLVVGSGSVSWDYIHNLTPHFFINLVWALIIFYLFYFYFIRFFEKKYLGKYLLYSFLTSIALTVLLFPLHKLFFTAFNLFDIRYWLPPVAGTFIIAQCGSLIRGFENWFSDLQLKSEIENRNLKNELEILRSQINPHFLFNALNNLDSFIHSDADKASEYLVTLSSMLRYMIYESGTEVVPLDKELQYLKNYIRLQQMRFRNKDYAKVTLPENCQGVILAPMIFIPFIENAFKYAHFTDFFPVIEIFLACKDDRILFQCRNYCDVSIKTSDNACGFGLENARKRLALLYPEKHELLIFEKDNQFIVELTISRL